MRKLILTICLLAPLATAAPASAAKGSCPQYEALFRQYHLPVKAFSYISWRESRCQPKSVSPIRRTTGRPDVGLVQISGAWKTVTHTVCRLRPNQDHILALTNVNCNLAVAHYLYTHGGLAHWRPTSGLASKASKK